MPDRVVINLQVRRRKTWRRPKNSDSGSNNSVLRCVRDRLVSPSSAASRYVVTADGSAMTRIRRELTDDSHCQVCCVAAESAGARQWLRKSVSRWHCHCKYQTPAVPCHRAPPQLFFCLANIFIILKMLFRRFFRGKKADESSRRTSLTTNPDLTRSAQVVVTLSLRHSGSGLPASSSGVFGPGIRTVCCRDIHYLPDNNCAYVTSHVVPPLQTLCYQNIPLRDERLAASRFACNCVSVLLLLSYVAWNVQDRETSAISDVVEEKEMSWCKDVSVSVNI
ncbi:hypothetical protein J6590_004924 [Homalodisca vitripennis]|nr:hypothetical protein J6590_004924 [Homalodisca vitripennis]